MAAAKEQLRRFCQELAHGAARISGGRTADDEGIHAVVMLFHKAPYGQGTHAVAEKDQRELRIFFVKGLVDEINVLQKSLCAASVHVA